MTALIKQQSLTTVPRKGQAGIFGLLVGTGAGGPLAKVSMGLVSAVSPDTFEALNQVAGFTTGLEKFFMVAFTVGAYYFTRERA